MEYWNDNYEDTSLLKNILTKTIDKPSKYIAIVTSDCAISIVLSVLVATNSSKKISNMNSTTTRSQLSIKNNKSCAASFPVQQINSTKNSCISRSSRVKDTDGYSSHGRETIEPKSARSRCLTDLSSKNTDKQSNEASTP